MSRDSLLKKEFKEADVKRVRNLVNKDFTAGAIDKEYDSFIARIEAFASVCEVSDMLEYEGIIKSLSFRTKLIFPSMNASLFPR